MPDDMALTITFWYSKVKFGVVFQRWFLKLYSKMIFLKIEHNEIIFNVTLDIIIISKDHICYIETWCYSCWLLKLWVSIIFSVSC